MSKIRAGLATRTDFSRYNPRNPFMKSADSDLPFPLRNAFHANSNPSQVAKPRPLRSHSSTG